MSFMMNGILVDKVLNKGGIKMTTYFITIPYGAIVVFGILIAGVGLFLYNKNKHKK